MCPDFSGALHLIFVVCCAMVALIWKVVSELVARVVQRGQDTDTSSFFVKVWPSSEEEMPHDKCLGSNSPKQLSSPDKCMQYASRATKKGQQFHHRPRANQAGASKVPLWGGQHKQFMYSCLQSYWMKKQNSTDDAQVKCKEKDLKTNVCKIFKSCWRPLLHARLLHTCV